MIYVNDPALYATHRWARGRSPVSWIVVHDPGGSDVATSDAILRYLRAAAATYNEYLYRPERRPPAGQVVAHQLSLPSEYVGHAGRASRIPGTNVRHGVVNARTWGISVHTRGRRLDDEMWMALVEVIVRRIRQFGLPDAGVALGHREVATERTDPRGVNMTDLRKAVERELADGTKWHP